MHRLIVAALAVTACGSTTGSAPPPVTSHGTPGVAIALVYSGWEIWIGNDDLLPQDDPSRYPGALHDLAAALDDSFSKRGDSDVGVLIAYSDKAKVMAPMGPLARITGSSLGTQKDYFKTNGSELAAGVELGLAQLHDTSAARKVLIVVGDGIDTNNEAARTKLAALKDAARADHTEVFAIIHKSAVSEANDVVHELTPNVQTAPSGEAIRKAFATVIAQCCARSS